MKTFTFEINLCEVLSESAIWPDGNAPPNPTLKDVERLFFLNANVHATCQAWGLEITKGDVTITEPDVTAGELGIMADDERSGSR